MPSALPDGEPAPASGELPESALALLDGHPFGVYVHVPFCSVRCGYCDFNTYTLTELGVDGASQATYADAALAELDLAVTRAGSARRPRCRRCSSVAARRPCWPPTTSSGCWSASATASASRRGAEVTTEANPDSVTPESLKRPGRRRLHPRERRHAVGGAVRARDPRAHPRPGQRPARRRRRPCRRARRQPRPDLRHAGGVAARLARQPRPPRSPARPTTSRPTRWWSRRAPSSRPRYGAARCPPPRTTTRPPSTSWPTRSCRRPATAGTRSATGRSRTADRCRHNVGYWTGGRLVGRRSRRAQPRRWRALVERQAPQRLRLPRELAAVTGRRP